MFKINHIPTSFLLVSIQFSKSQTPRYHSENAMSTLFVYSSLCITPKGCFRSSNSAIKRAASRIPTSNPLPHTHTPCPRNACPHIAVCATWPPAMCELRVCAHSRGVTQAFHTFLEAQRSIYMVEHANPGWWAQSSVCGRGCVVWVSI